MTKLDKIVSRISQGKIFEKSKNREVIIILEPPNILSFRLKGTRRKYSLTSEACFILALKADLLDKSKQKRKSKRVSK